MSLLNSNQLQTLSSSEPFKDLDGEALKLVAEKCKIIFLPTQSILFKQEDIDDGLYVIEKGRVSIDRKKLGSAEADRIAINVAGDTIGSLAINNPHKRSASVHILTASSFIKFSKQSFTELAQHNPDICTIIEQALLQRTHRLYLGLVMRSNPILARLPPEVLVAIENTASISQVKNGALLWQQDEPSNYFYIVITGRLRIWHNDPAAIQSGLQKEISPGEMVGEYSTIIKENRQFSLRALRDSTLARISREQLTELLTRYPDVINTLLVKTVTHHFTKAHHDHQHAKNASHIIALIPINTHISADETGQQLGAALSVNDSTLVLNSTHIDELLGIPGFAQSSLSNSKNPTFLNWLNDLEFKYDHIILMADNSCSNWTRRCIHQADHLLFVAHSGGSPQLGDIEHQLLSTEKHLGVRKTLLLIHPSEISVPTDTQAWLAQRQIGMHHHLRQHNKGDFARLARFLTGRSVGLVLGGGAARGFAHIGVLRALKENNIAVDLIGGTSMGALIAAQYAMQKPLDDIIRDTLKLCMGGDKLTIPLVSLYEGYKMSKGLEDFFGTVAIEDLWCRYYSVSCNLSRAKLMVHDTGILIDAVMASNIPPGLFPPKVVQGDLLVDGGLLNNVPVDVMIRYNEGGTLIAVDVNPKDDLFSTTDYQHGLSGWQVLRHKMNPFKSKMHIPSIIDVLMRSTTIGGLAQQKNVMTGIADLYLQPPVAEFPLLGYKNAEKIAESGYQYALTQIAAWQLKQV